MKGKVIIVSSDAAEKTFSKHVLYEACDQEVTNYCFFKGMTGGLNELVVSGYLVIISNGGYHKIYLNNNASVIQKIELYEFLSKITGISSFVRITILSKSKDEVVLDGLVSPVEIEEFIEENTSSGYVDKTDKKEETLKKVNN